MKTKPVRWVSGSMALLFALCLGFAGLAEAAEGGQHDGGHRDGGNHGGDGHRGGGRDHRDGGYHRDEHGWGGGYRRAPPVVFGAPYVCVPPLIYSPYVPSC